MGSDLYMAEQSFRSRGYRARWEADTLIVEKDVFCHGWQVTWSKESPSSEEIEVVKSFTGLTDIPSKPDFVVVHRGIWVARDEQNRFFFYRDGSYSDISQWTEQDRMDWADLVIDSESVIWLQRETFMS